MRGGKGKWSICVSFNKHIPVKINQPDFKLDIICFHWVFKKIKIFCTCDKNLKRLIGQSITALLLLLYKTKTFSFSFINLALFCKEHWVTAKWGNVLHKCSIIITLLCMIMVCLQHCVRREGRDRPFFPIIFYFEKFNTFIWTLYWWSVHVGSVQLIHVLKAMGTNLANECLAMMQPHNHLVHLFAFSLLLYGSSYSCSLLFKFLLLGKHGLDLVHLSIFLSQGYLQLRLLFQQDSGLFSLRVVFPPQVAVHFGYLFHLGLQLKPWQLKMNFHLNTNTLNASFWSYTHFIVSNYYHALSFKPLVSKRVFHSLTHSLTHTYMTERMDKTKE